MNDARQEAFHAGWIQEAVTRAEFYCVARLDDLASGGAADFERVEEPTACRGRLVGGFATPALLSTGEDRPICLFSYLLLLNAGLAWVAYRKKWPHLTVLSTIFTTLFQWGWVMKFLTAAKLPLALGIFLGLSNSQLRCSCSG